MSDPTVTILDSKFHRNGVTGEPFYAFTIECEGETLVATIGTSVESCRVINPLDISKCYRGDYIGQWLIIALVRDMGEQIVAGMLGESPPSRRIDPEFVRRVLAGGDIPIDR